MSGNYESGSGKVGEWPQQGGPASSRGASRRPNVGEVSLERVTAAVGALLQARRACEGQPQLVAELDRALPHLANVRRALLNLQRPPARQAAAVSGR